jgi:hypothetical protein
MVQLLIQCVVSSGVFYAAEAHLVMNITLNGTSKLAVLGAKGV